MKLSTALQTERFQWAMMLLMTALVMRALIPVGFMPGQNAHGGLTMVICAGAEAEPREILAGDHDPDAPKKSGSDAAQWNVCGFATNAVGLEGCGGPLKVAAPLNGMVYEAAHYRTPDAAAPESYHSRAPPRA